MRRDGGCLRITLIVALAIVALLFVLSYDVDVAENGSSQIEIVQRAAALPTPTPIPATPTPTSTKEADPTSEASPTPAATPTSTPTPLREYEVQVGDTLSAIADRFGVEVSDLIAANDIADPNVVQVGAILEIPHVNGAQTDQVHSRSSTPTLECPTPEQQAYFERIASLMLRWYSSATQMLTLLTLSEDNPLLLFDDKWKLSWAGALVELDNVAIDIDALDAPSGADEVHANLRRLSPRLHAISHSLAEGLDDLAALERAVINVQEATRIAETLAEQRESFCELTPTPAPIPTATSTPVLIQMELAELLDEYDQNKVRANSRLRYQENGEIPVSTSGYISEIEELYVVVTPTQEQFLSPELHCYYADTRAALHLTKGQRVSVTGRVRGTDGYSSNVHMYLCEIEEIQLEKSPTVSAQELRNNVVQVFCLKGTIFTRGYKGTGIIMDAEEGIVLTVHHVVADENDCEKIEVEVPGIESRIPATTVKHCASIDRARLRISPQVLSGLSLQSIYRAAAPAHADQEIFFWGYGPGELRMGTGIVKDVFGENIVTDAYAVPGDSGSPVFDENGHLLGTMSRSNRSDRAVFTGDEC